MAFDGCKPENRASILFHHAVVAKVCAIHTHSYSIAGIELEVQFKSVKYLRLRITPSGTVQVSAPWKTSWAEIDNFVQQHQGWIKAKQAELAARPAPAVAEFTDGETHYLWGRAYALATHAKPDVMTDESAGRLWLPDVDRTQRSQALQRFFHQQMQSRLVLMLEHWCPKMGVSINKCSIKSMKTRWGSCNIKQRRINLSLELAQKPPACLEMVLVHELVHLFERGHNPRFYRLMDYFLPDWRVAEMQLKHSPGVCFKTGLFRPGNFEEP